MPYNPGSGSMFAGSSPNVSNKSNNFKFKWRRIYQLGVKVPHAGCKKPSADCDDAQFSSW